MIAIIVAVVIIVVFVIAMLLLKNNKTESSASNPQSNTNNSQSNTNNTNTMSESDAIALAQKKYERIHDYYFMDGSSDDSIIDNENEYYRIENYDEITTNLTTSALQTLTNDRGIITKNGKYYILDLARGTNIYYLGNDGFEVKSITNDRLEFIVKEKYLTNSDDVGKEASEITDFEYQNNPFVLVKEDGKWKVDEFTLPN